ncbi:hypothetical protein BDY24DRAFT_337123 [Mrakia frigida]|uniref:alkene reductase n=1 Tax=Mrakia frigida TaxID=29902 RepID=UPI003FCC11B4
MSSVASSSRLFTPLKLGPQAIHRIALAPLTRLRNSQENQVPGAIVAEYYEQRASEGGLLISEATTISREAGGYAAAPGIYTPEQIEAWKDVTSKVHAKGGLIYLQLWALGRTNQGGQPGIETVSASALPLKGTTIVPRELTVEDIARELRRVVRNYKQAALNAIEAGFDGVEIHNANGQLPDQFLQSVSNKRTDAYGGSLENRARFPLEIARAVTEAVGQERTGIRLSPWSSSQDQLEPQPKETFGFFTKALVSEFPKLAYVHFTEAVNEKGLSEENLPSNDYVNILTSFPIEPSHADSFFSLSSDGFTRERAVTHGNRTGDVVVFGRFFIANPDLPARIREGIEFAPYDRNTFYTPGPVGYTDYPTAVKAQA